MNLHNVVLLLATPMAALACYVAYRLSRALQRRVVPAQGRNVEHGLMADILTGVDSLREVVCGSELDALRDTFLVLLQCLPRIESAIGEARASRLVENEKILEHEASHGRMLAKMAVHMADIAAQNKVLIRAMGGQPGNEDDEIMDRARALREQYPEISWEEAISKARQMLMYSGR